MCDLEYGVKYGGWIPEWLLDTIIKNDKTKTKFCLENILRYQKLSEKFINEHSDIISEHNGWGLISQFQQHLSEEFRNKFNLGPSCIENIKTHQFVVDNSAKGLRIMILNMLEEYEIGDMGWKCKVCGARMWERTKRHNKVKILHENLSCDECVIKDIIE
jgi:hypothetical protein